MKNRNDIAVQVGLRAGRHMIDPKVLLERGQGQYTPDQPDIPTEEYGAHRSRQREHVSIAVSRQIVELRLVSHR